MVQMLLHHQNGSSAVVSSQSLLRKPQNPYTLIGVFRPDRCHSSPLLLRGKEQGSSLQFLTVPPAQISACTDQRKSVSYVGPSQELQGMYARFYSCLL